MNILSSIINSFIQALSEAARNEKKMEFLKERLCTLESFEPYSVFRMLDKEGKGYLNKEDFSRLFQENNIFISERKIKTYFINHHDRDKDEKINYSEYNIDNYWFLLIYQKIFEKHSTERSSNFKNNCYATIYLSLQQGSGFKK